MPRPPRDPRPLRELDAAIAASPYTHQGFARLVGERLGRQVRPDYLSHMLAGRKPALPGLFAAAAAVLGRPEAELRPREGVTA